MFSKPLKNSLPSSSNSKLSSANSYGLVGLKILTFGKGLNVVNMMIFFFSIFDGKGENVCIRQKILHEKKTFTKPEQINVYEHVQCGRRPFAVLSSHAYPTRHCENSKTFNF